MASFWSNRKKAFAYLVGAAAYGVAFGATWRHGLGGLFGDLPELVGDAVLLLGLNIPMLALLSRAVMYGARARDERNAADGVEASSAEREPLKLILAVRATTIFCLLLNLIAVPLTVHKHVAWLFLAAFILSFCMDSVMSYAYPVEAKMTSTKALKAAILKMTLFANPATSRIQALGMAIVSAILFSGALWMGYWS